MRVTYRLTFEDYYDALRTRTAKSRRARECAVVVIAALLGVAWVRTTHARVGYMYVSLGILFIASLPAARWLNKLSFKNAYNKGACEGSGQECSLHISEDGIQVVGAPFREDWSRFSKYSESNRAFILYRSNSIEAILPKRAFDQSGVSDIRLILRAKLTRL